MEEFIRSQRRATEIDVIIFNRKFLTSGSISLMRKILITQDKKVSAGLFDK
jgi:hypothetical protein